MPVRVVEPRGHRFATEDARAVERVMPFARFYWLGESVAPNAEALAPYWEAVEIRAADCDLKGAWRVLVERGQLGEVDAAEVALLALGEATASSVDAVVRAIFDRSVHFKVRKGRVEVCRPEAVDAALEAHRAEIEAQAAMKLALPVLRAAMASAGVAGAVSGGVGEVAEPATAAVARALGALSSVASLGREGDDLAFALQVMEGLNAPQGGDITTKAFEILVGLGEFNADENIFARRAKLRRVFPREVLEEAERLVEAGPKQRRAKDLRHLLTVAIDDPETTEVDDAFAFSGSVLHVFIADVAAWVPRGSAVEREAAKRVSTVYLPEGKIPMLPPVIAEHAASLIEGEDRPALCFAFELNDEGTPIGYEVFEAQIRVDHQLAYDEASEFLTGAVEGGALGELVRRAGQWMALHRSHRDRLGAVTLSRNEVRIHVEPSGRVQIRRADASGPARELVSELMVSACAGAATFCQDSGIPCIYRVQSRPDGRVTQGGKISDPAERVAILRRLKPTQLTTKPGGHFTLGVDCYTQVTSPIRRYQDLIMHDQLRSWLRTGRPSMAASALRGTLDELERKVGALRRVEYQTRRYWTIRYLEQRPGELVRAVIVRPAGRKWLAELIDLGLQISFDPTKSVHPGEELELEVAEADARSDRLVLRIQQ